MNILLIFFLIIVLMSIYVFTTNIYIWIIVTFLILFLICDYLFNNKSHMPNNQNKCIKTGCSGQICSDVPKMSTCEWKCEDACVRNAQCKNINGSCQWEIDNDIKNCLEKCSRENKQNIIL